VRCRLFAPIRVVLIGNLCVLHVYIFMQINDDDDDMVQLMPLHPKTPSSLASFKSRLVYLVLAYPGCPGKEV